MIDYSEISIPMYVINLPEREDRRKHIREQFNGRGEFALTIVEASGHSQDSFSLWNSIVNIVDIAMVKDDDVIIICEDGHEFTPHYSKQFLFDSILRAFDLGCNMVLGGVSWFNQAIPITRQLSWVDNFYGTQLIVLNKYMFPLIRREPFGEKDTADGKLSALTSLKMLIYPFISVQKDFGYSDIRSSECQGNGSLANCFYRSNKKLEMLIDICDRHSPGRLTKM
ncbi:glycosyl transferase [Parapedobacter defluvii]|uniref:Glycosyl transferase n=1 Tax=Parapedobacter defluvii TaxID=2045106 RepID=A0ABQ1MAX2_9SPHI|nr:glycosyl transferase [Parapedobacter defluvii]GGC36248.1 glycosyl transferase [Parapedobacter defluvii]